VTVKVKTSASRWSKSVSQVFRVVVSRTVDTLLVAQKTHTQFSLSVNPETLLISFLVTTFIPQVPGKPDPLVKAINETGVCKNGEKCRFLTNKSLYLQNDRK